MKQKTVKQDLGINIKIIALMLVVAFVLLLSSGGFMSVMAVEESSYTERDKVDSGGLNKTVIDNSNETPYKYENGQAVSKISDAYILKKYNYSENWNTNLSIGKTYTVNADIIDNAIFASYFINPK